MQLAVVLDFSAPVSPHPSMNAPTLYDRFIVPEGKRKVSFAADTKVESAGTFTVQREDHTLGTCGASLWPGGGL